MPNKNNDLLPLHQAHKPRLPQFQLKEVRNPSIFSKPQPKLVDAVVQPEELLLLVISLAQMLLLLKPPLVDWEISTF